MIRLFVALAALAGLLLPAVPALAQSCGTGYGRAAAVRSYGAYGYAAPAAAVYVQPYQPQTTYTYSSYYQALAVPAYSVTYAPDGAQQQINQLKTELELKSLKVELQAIQLKQAQLQQPPPGPPPYEPQTGPPEQAPSLVQPRQQRPQPMPPADQQPQAVPTSYLQPRRIVATAAVVQQRQPHYGLRQACAACHDAATKSKGGGLALFDRGRPVMSAQQQLASIRAITEGRMPLRAKLTPGQRVALIGELGQSVAVNR